jgi:hypothetical protein
MTRQTHSTVFTAGLLVVALALALATLSAAVVSPAAAPAGQPELSLLRQVAHVLGRPANPPSASPRAALD